MISRTNRFHGHNSLQYLYKQGTTVRGSALSLRYCVNTKRHRYRLAVVVSKKVSKSAVVRNRIRRRIYEFVRILSNEGIAPYDLALLVYDEKVATMQAAELAQEITKLCLKAGIITASTPDHATIVDKKE